MAITQGKIYPGDNSNRGVLLKNLNDLATRI